MSRLLGRLDRHARIVYLVLLVLACTSLTVLLLLAKRSNDRANAKVAAFSRNLCLSTNISRADSNRHLRQPLKTFATEAADTRRQSASAEGEPKRSIDLEAARKYQAIADSVRLLSPLDCSKGTPKQQAHNR